MIREVEGAVVLSGWSGYGNRLVVGAVGLWQGRKEGKREGRKKGSGGGSDEGRDKERNDNGRKE